MLLLLGEILYHFSGKHSVFQGKNYKTKKYGFSFKLDFMSLNMWWTQIRQANLFGCLQFRSII